MQLSKSDYMLFLRHPAWLWLKKHNKSKLPAVDAALQAMFDDGHLFEEYADRLFPDAVTVGFSFADNNYRSMPSRTKEVLESGAKTIFQGRLETKDITCIFDVVERVEGNTFDLIEIKSSTEVKDDHISDLAFQTIVLEECGLSIRKIFVIHVNNEYIRHGEIDIREFTSREDVTERVRDSIPDTEEGIEKALKVAHSTSAPDYSPRHTGNGALSEWMDIYHLLFPEKHNHSIFKLTRINAKLIGQFEDLGIERIQDIPETIELNEKQLRQVKVTKENARIIKKEKIQQFLKDLIFPLYFLDYETFKSVVPPFDGTKPYQQIPFQYSLHKLDKEGVLTHTEYLHLEQSNPTLSLIKQLVKDIGTSGTVLVWYESFEKGRNKELGEMYPEYKDAMEKINSRVVDLIIPFAEGWYVDKDFFGSASIKKVMPVLITDLSYDKLLIQEGEGASREWTETIFEGKNKEKREIIVQALREYCRLDTLAMVQLYKFLQNEV